MATLQTTLPEPLRQFEKNHDAFWDGIDEETRQRYEQKVGEAIDADRWTRVPEDRWPEFWNGIRQKVKQLREARSAESKK